MNNLFELSHEELSAKLNAMRKNQKEKKEPFAFGSALRGPELVPKYLTVDPWKHLPFTDLETHNNLSQREWGLYFTLVFVLIVTLICFQF